MKERIRHFLDRENKSSSKFAEEMGIQPSGVSHILSGRNKPSLDFILKMLNTYPDLDTDWLLFGRGQMYKPGENPSLFDENEVEPGINTDEEAEKDNLFDYDSNIEAGEIDTQKHASGKEPDTAVNDRFSERIIIFYPDGTYREYSRRK